MFWKKKGRGTPKQEVWLIVQVKFLFPLVFCLSNSCLNPYTESTLSKGIISVHIGFEYLKEPKWIMLAHCTGVHFSQVVLLDYFC